MMNVNALKLNFQFDGDRMKQELESISDSFKPIENAYTGNSLHGMHLIIPTKDGIPNDKGETFKMTEELEKCPYLQEVLNTFKSNKLTFRTQNLLPGGRIGRHNDGDKGLDSNVVRLNIPVATNDDVHIYYNEERIPMKNGDCWLPDVKKIHEMKNDSDETRWQIMVDCDLNDWWKEVLKEHGVSIDTSTYGRYSLEELHGMKERFISMDMKEMIEELELEIASRV
ncbi:MAG: aspartyl/asparaginyl beta-hydroxylase domain-containing protein [Flavobacteriaceae bacterium]